MTKSVYTIAPGQNFSKVLARYLLDQTQNSPDALTNYRLLLPTRRACRTMRDAFLQINNGRPMLLPIMTPIGDVDGEDLSLMMFGQAEGVFDIPEAIAPLQRQLMLSKLIQSLPDFVQGPDHALALAQSLCSLIDQVLVEELDFSALDTLVPEDFASHWQITLDFLKIVSKHWPAILKAHNLIESVERRRLMLQALAQHWSDHPPKYPVIAAGATGSIPAVGEFLGAVSDLFHGAVILPGLDCALDDDAWGQIKESHPQFILKKTLAILDVAREDVQLLGEEVSSRSGLGNIAMLPAEVSDRWGDVKLDDFSGAFEGLQYYSCKTEHQEASLIALMMRETLEDSEKICAFVTPDRVLARRVSAACRRWNIEVDDSAGQSLADHDLGKFSLLILNAVSGGYDPAALLALLKSPLCCVRRNTSERRSLAHRLECDVLRQDDIINSFDVLRSFIKDDGVLSFFDDVYGRLQKFSHSDGSFLGYLKVHLEVMEFLAGTDEQEGVMRLWCGDAGESAAHLFTELFEHGALIDSVSLREYEKIFRALLKGAQVRSAYGVHPRLLILGQLEARLTHADRIIMGGLNEGSWTPNNNHDPWMSKLMRKRFGLPSVDQAIGIAAHDFMQGFSCADVILTRSEKVERSPSIPVRWLARLETVMKASGRELDDLTNPSYFQWLEALDDHGDFVPNMRPEPKPPLVARPNGASVTKIEKWLQDPYSIYAYYSLNLRPVKPLVQDNDAALRGTVLHEILECYTKDKPTDHQEERLIQIAHSVTKEKVIDADMLHYWWPKFYRIAHWFVQHEEVWRENAAFLCSEAKGEVALDIDGIPFKLYGYADRIDRMHGGYALIDYKSGGSFTKTGLKNGVYPQLPLEALMIARGGFEGVEASLARYLGYWKLTGGQKAGEIISIEGDLECTLGIVENGLKELVRFFRDVSVPYYAVPDVMNAPRFNDYEHLARLKEWTALGYEESGSVS